MGVKYTVEANSTNTETLLKGHRGTILFTKTHSHKRVAEKKTPTDFKRTIDKHKFMPYLLLTYDAAKEWLTLKEQVT